MLCVLKDPLTKLKCQISKHGCQLELGDEWWINGYTKSQFCDITFGFPIMHAVGSFDYEKFKVIFHLAHTRSKCAALEFLRSFCTSDILENYIWLNENEIVVTMLLIYTGDTDISVVFWDVKFIPNSVIKQVTLTTM